MEEQNQPKKNKSMLLWVVILVLCCMVAGGIYDTWYGSGTIKSWFVQSETKQNESANGILAELKLDAGQSSSFAVFGQSFALCTKDGVKYFQSFGDQKWSDTFNMTAPTMQQEGNFIAVGDLGGKQIRVYGMEGLLYQVQVEGSLRQFAINETGYLSLIQKKDQHYEILVYNAAGTLLKGRMEERAGIYPISSDISDDNKAFAVSYVDTSDVMPIGRVLFFYIGQEDSENYTDSLFASIDRTNEILGTIAYRADGSLTVVSDRGIYGVKDGTILWEYTLTNALSFLSLQNKNRIVFAIGEPLLGQESKEVGTVCWLNLNGKEEGSFVADDSINYLFAGEDGFVLGYQKEYVGMRYSAKEQWRLEAAANVFAVLPMESFTKVLSVSGQKALILDMTKYHGGVQTVVEKSTEETPTEETPTEETPTEETPTEETPTEEMPTEETPTEETPTEEAPTEETPTEETSTEETSTEETSTQQPST